MGSVFEMLSRTAVRRSLPVGFRAVAAPSLNLQRRDQSTAANESALAKIQKNHGSFHWWMHRVSAIGMLTLVPATVMTGAGSVPACALSVMAPYHFSLGVESAIDDYCPVGDIKELANFGLRLTVAKCTKDLLLFNMYGPGLAGYIDNMAAVLL